MARALVRAGPSNVGNKVFCQMASLVQGLFKVGKGLTIAQHNKIVAAR